MFIALFPIIISASRSDPLHSHYYSYTTSNSQSYRGYIGKMLESGRERFVQGLLNSCWEVFIKNECI